MPDKFNPSCSKIFTCTNNSHLRCLYYFDTAVLIKTNSTNLGWILGKKKKKVPWENAEKKSSVIENVRYFKSAKEENQIIFGKNADCILILFKNILWLLTDTIR